MILFASPRFAEHTTPPGHPERPERAEVFDAVADAWRAQGGAVVDVRLATEEELLRIHTADYVKDVLALAGRASMLDADTYTSPESVEIARLAAGTAIDAARAARTHNEPVVALVRPPGHHAESDRAMGFCLFNNVAIAAAALRADGADRVAIVDIDVHHGNGTQASFYRDADVFYASTHQTPYYPGTGATEECGAGAGAGATLNVPLAAGASDAEFIAAYDRQIVPALEAYRPDAILVSAGFDAHRLDPLGGLRVSTDGFRQVATLLDALSRRVCHRRSVWITEGGYHLGALRECLDATISVLT